MIKNVYDIQSGVLIDNLYCFKGSQDKITQVTYDNNNYVFSFDKDSNVCELVIYKQPFITPKHIDLESDLINNFEVEQNFESFMSSRKFKLDSNGSAVPVKDTSTLSDLERCLRRGGNRAIKTFYDYALANVWEYFCTFTFADEKIRLDKDELIKAWQGFIKGVRKNNPDVKAIAVYERFEKEKSGFHMHALLSKCDLTLKPARNPKNNNSFMYSNASNEQLFNCLDWNLGHNMVAPIRADSNNSRVVNYLCKYVTKASPAPYGCRRFFQTNNLDCRQTVVGYSNNFDEYINKFGLRKVEKKDKFGNVFESDKLTVYRNY